MRLKILLVDAGISSQLATRRCFYVRMQRHCDDQCDDKATSIHIVATLIQR